MANQFYTPSGTPASGSAGLSALIRNEFAAIQTAFGLLPVMTGAGNGALVVNPGGTAITTTGALSLAGAFTTTGAFSTTLAQQASVTLTLPAASGTLATLAGVETLSNKTFVSPALGTPASGNLTNCTGTATGLTAGNATNAVTAANQSGGTVSATTISASGTVTFPDGSTWSSAATGITTSGNFGITGSGAAQAQALAVTIAASPSTAAQSGHQGGSLVLKGGAGSAGSTGAAITLGGGGNSGANDRGGTLILSGGTSTGSGATSMIVAYSPIVFPLYLVAALPPPSGALIGARAVVTDCNARLFGSVVGGGGGQVAPVFCDGTYWVMG